MILLHEQISSYVAGLKRARQWESKLKSDWDERLAEIDYIRQLHYQEEVRGWLATKTELDRSYETQLRAWQEGESAKDRRQRQRLEEWAAQQENEAKLRSARKAKWEQEILRHEGSWANQLLISGGSMFLLGVLSLVLIILFYLFHAWDTGASLLLAVGVLFFLVSLILAGLGSLKTIRLERERKNLDRKTHLRQPMRESPSPQPRPGALKPEPVPPKALPRLELAGAWLRALRVRAGSLPVEAPQGYGYLGENRLFELLDKGLPGEEFLCLRNLLVLRHMDIDLVVIGPNGIWLLDSKYWSGWIRYHNGIWTRDRDLNEGEDHPDLKWAEQENRVRMTLNNNLGHLSIDWEKIIRGGLVFTHPEVNLQIIPLCPVEAGTVHLWVRWIRETEPAVGFDLETRLKAVDALCIRSQRLRKEENPDFQTVPAARIAETVYGAAVAEARRIVERG